MVRRLLLIGGGHSHIEVIRRFGLTREPGVVITLISPDRYTPYSGMLPGYIAGHYAFNACHIDLEALCRRTGVERVETWLTGLDPEHQLVRCAQSSAIAYDVVSIDTGSTPALDDIRGAQHCGVPVKPVAAFLREWMAMRASAQKATTPVRLAVVGGGAAGVEIALAMQYRIAMDGGRARIVLITDGPTILATQPHRVQRHFRALLHARGVDLRLDARVECATEDGLEMHDGTRLPLDHIVWVTGAAAPAWTVASGVSVDARGFINVNRHLQSISHERVFAAGDIASAVDTPHPKSGVYAVRQGPPLTENLRRALGARRLVNYQPQSTALALLSAGNRHAVAAYGRLSFAGDWVWHWKNRIDTAFVRKYNHA